MVIVYLTGGLGNQLFQYAAGRRLALKWNTELKLDTTFFDGYKLRSYVLDKFNVQESFLMPEELNRLQELIPNNSFGIEINSQQFMPEVLNYPDNVRLNGCWENERYFADIADVIQQEFTLKQPLGAAAQQWQKKIIAADCSVSLHIRHGDFVYNPNISRTDIFAHLPLDYYQECVNRLKQNYPNLTAFVFSNNLQWCKENLHLDIPTEYICGEGLSDVEELHLMSLCKHNIIANSTFSWWGAWLNRNPDKKVFVPIPQSIVDTNKTYRHFSAERNENSPLDSDRWTRVPFDTKKQPEVTIRPWFSLLLVVNNDIATLRETLGTILSQDYKFFEVIIIDNASFDGSNKICQQAAKFSDKIKLIKLYDKISNGAAWNMALNAAQGQYVMFLKGNDRLVANTLSFLYLANERVVAEVVNAAVWLREDSKGNIAMAGRKFIVEGDAHFRNLKDKLRQRFDKLTVLKILSANANAVPIATKIFNRKFLLDNAIKFDEKISDADAELLFMTDAMMRTDEEMLFLPNPFYVAPKI